MIGLTPDITDASVPQHSVLRLTFADGVTGEIYVLDRMRGPVFERAMTPQGFAEVTSVPRPELFAGLVAQTSPRTRSTSACGPAFGPPRSKPPDGPSGPRTGALASLSTRRRQLGTVVWPNGADLKPLVLHADFESASRLVRS
jgi:hypothetical protein